MFNSVKTSVPAPHSDTPKVHNEFVFVIHQESNVGQYHQYLLKRMFNRPELSDVTLRCDGQDIPAHRIVLATHSPFFIRKFDENPTNGLVITIDNVQHGILMAALELMYQGRVSIAAKLEPTLYKLMENLEIKGVVINPNTIPVNAVTKTTDKNAEKKKKLGETTTNVDEKKLNEKKQRVEIQPDIRENSVYDEFVSAIDRIVRTVNEDNIDAKATELLRCSIYTKERLVTVVNLIIRQVISIGCQTPTICYAKLSAAIKARDRSHDGFTSILLNFCRTFFTANIERKLVRPDSAEASVLNAFDQQIQTLRMIEYHYSNERLRRIVRFLSELYTQNVINGGLLLEIQARELENLDRGIHDYFFVLLAIFDAAGKMLSEEHPNYTNECVAKLKEQLAAMENNQILTDVKALIAQAIEMSESGWKNESSTDASRVQHLANESLPSSDVEEHLYWMRNSLSREPAKLTYHLARNLADQNKEPRRRGKQNANKPQVVQKNPSDRGNTLKPSERGGNVAKTSVTERTTSHQEQLPAVNVKRTNNPQSTRNVANNEPRTDGHTEMAAPRRTRGRRRMEKFIAEKIASKRK